MTLKVPAINRARRGIRSGKTSSVPAPIGGWNARDPLAAMKPQEAVWLENWWPGTADVTVRSGVDYHVTGFAAPVKSLMCYNKVSGNSELFAATDSGIYNVSSAGAVGAAVVAITNGVCYHTMFTVAGGNYLVVVNGTDKLLLYNGTTWQFIDNASVPAITGLATTSLINVCIFKQRLWFVQINSLSAWYLPVSVVGGVLTEFPIGQLCKRGGYLVAMTTWTIDGGAGADDYLVFITSEGECVVYKGVDPAVATDFNLVGVYYVGEPVGRKCFIKLGGDVLILTQIGLVPLSKIVQSSVLDRSLAVSSKIDLKFSEAASVYGASKGWCGVVYPTENMLLVNIPTAEFTTSCQFVMNTITKAWALFTGWDAFCWEIMNGELFFGSSTFVAKIYGSQSDYGNNITATAQCAYNYFGTPSIKHIKMLRPLLKLDGSCTLSFSISTDFSSDVTYADIPFGIVGNAEWDSGIWDSSSWAVDYEIKKEWRTVFCKDGFCASVLLRVQKKSVNVGWTSTDILYSQGGVL